MSTPSFTHVASVRQQLGQRDEAIMWLRAGYVL